MLPTILLLTMLFSGMLCHVPLVKTDVLEETIASFVSVTRIGEVGTKLAVTGNQSMLHHYTIKLGLIVLFQNVWKESRKIRKPFNHESLSLARTEIKHLRNMNHTLLCFTNPLSIAA
jgi:hypothetical protein